MELLEFATLDVSGVESAFVRQTIRPAHAEQRQLSQGEAHKSYQLHPLYIVSE